MSENYLSPTDTGEGLAWLRQKIRVGSAFAQEALSTMSDEWRCWVFVEDAPLPGPATITEAGARRDMDKALRGVVSLLNAQHWLGTLLIEDDMERFGETVEVTPTTGFVADRVVRWAQFPAEPSTLRNFILRSSSYTPFIAIGSTASPDDLGLCGGHLEPKVLKSLLRSMVLMMTTAFDDEGFVLATAPTVRIEAAVS